MRKLRGIRYRSLISERNPHRIFCIAKCKIYVTQAIARIPIKYKGKPSTQIAVWNTCACHTKICCGTDRETQSSCNRIKLLVAFETLLWILFGKLYIDRDVDYIWHTMNKQILAHEGLNKRTERLHYFTHMESPLKQK